jgi:hypothetical protein
MATTPTTPSDVDLLHEQRRTLAYGLLWGGVMLAILALWTRAKHPDFLTVGVVALLALAAATLAVGVWQLGQRPKVDQSPEQRATEFRQQQRLLGALLLGGGVILLLFAAWLWVSYGLNAFGEAVGLALFALIAMVGGVLCRTERERQPAQEKLMQGIAAQRVPVSVAMILLGAALTALGVYLRASLENPNESVPEWVGAVLLGLTWLASGLWLRFTAADLKLANMRLFVLVVGGATGLVIAVMTLWRAWLWRTEVFLGGLSAWTGGESYRFWLCAYIELAGLALMFGSLLLARTDVRSNPVLRRTLFGYNAVLTGLLLLAFLIVLNIVTYVSYPLNFDWSATRGLYSLSPSTQDILQKLEEPTEIYVLLTPRHDIMRDLKFMLDNVTAMTRKVKVHYISPDRDFREYETLAQKYPELLPDIRTALEEQELGRGVLVVYGPETKGQKAPRALISPRKLFEHKRDFHSARGKETKETLEFQGENALMTELRFLMEGQKKAKVYFLQGNGELDITANQRVPRRSVILEMRPFGAGKLVERLKKENLEIRGLSFDRPPKEAKGQDQISYAQETGPDKRKEIPDDARAVIIAGPSREIPKATLDALERYMEKNGRLLVFFDIMVDPKAKKMVRTGLEDFLKKYQVEVGDDYFMAAPLDPLLVVAGPLIESENLVAKQFLGQIFRLGTVRPVRVQKGFGKVKVEEILQVPPDPNTFIWTENAIAGLSDPFRFINEHRAEVRQKDIQEPVPVAVGVKEDDKPRLVVVGDTDLISNFWMGVRLEDENVGDLAFNFVASALDWLAERPGIGIRPKQVGTFSLGPKGEEIRGRIVGFPAWLMSLGVIGLGVGIWVVRRR